MLQIPLQLEPSHKTPLYEQLYRAIAAQIRSGALPAGSKLPGKRALAAELSVSVNTVDTAYQILTAEGYLESRPRSGFFAQSYTELSSFSPFAATDPPIMTAQNSPETATCPPAQPKAAAAGKPITKPTSVPHFPISTNGVDPSLFPFRTWGRIQKELLYSAPDLLLRGNAKGDENLRTALCEYFGAFRGVRCTPAQIIVGAGVEYLLSLLAPLLPNKGGVENPGYGRAQMVLENNGVTSVPIPLDEKGLDPHALRQSGAGFCYITPSHQFPLGITMPVGRRASLLQWANEGTAEHPRYLIEDDYDSEFRFDVRPLPALQGMNGAAERVIYLATFSKSLAPSIRIAAMVLPTHLLPLWHARYHSYASTVSRFDQQTLCRFLTEGYFTRHLSRTRNIYKARRDALVNALETTLGKENIALSGLHTGLHLLLQFKGDFDESTLLYAAHAKGIPLTPLRGYYRTANETCPPHTVVIGYGALEESLCASLASSLANALSEARVASVNS